MFNIIKLALTIFLVWAGIKIISNDAEAVGKAVATVQKEVGETSSAIKEGYKIEKGDTIR